MTEDEARDALFKLHFDYITHPPKERLILYEEYKKRRQEIRTELANLMLEKKQKELKIK